MKAILLGTAAGGGFPQWNCACPTCVNRELEPRTQDGLAISADGNDWFLVNASPDIRTQLLATPVLRAGPGLRETPIRGVLMTDAELDHTLGLMMLREGDGLAVHAPEAVLTALRDDFALQAIVSRYGEWSWSAVGSTQWIGGLRVRTLAVSNKRPKYSRVGCAGPWVVAYRFEDPATGGVLVYAPCLARWPDGFDEFVAGASVVLLDGTFYDAGELSGAVKAQEGAQSVMGHLPIGGPGGSLERIRQQSPAPAWLYTHLNNTNPILDPATDEYQELIAAGVEVPPDGTVLEL